MILPLVLILMATLTLLVVQSQFTARATYRAATARLQRAHLRVAAEEAAWHALHVLAADSDLAVDHTNEPWAAPRAALLPDGIRTVCRIVDENRFFDLNNLTVPVPVETKAGVPRLFRGAAPSPAEIVRYALMTAEMPAPDADVRRLQARLTELDTGVVSTASATSVVAHAVLESPEEWLACLPDSNAWARAGAVLTALPVPRTRPAPVNVNTASRDVLDALTGGRAATWVETVCRERDARPLAATALTASADIQRAGLLPYLDVRSAFFFVTAQAEKDDARQTVHGLVQRDAHGRITVLRWVCP